MARRFAGSTSTDKIAFGNVSTVTTRTYSFFMYIDALDTTGRRIMDWATGANAECVLAVTSNNYFEYLPGFSTTHGDWKTQSAPPTGQWVQVVMTYDGSSIENDPVIYFNGSSQAITEVTKPNGTLDSGSLAFTFGNRSANDRAFDGALAEFAQWSRILDAGEIATLATGYSPAFIMNGLRFYVPLIGKFSPETDIKGLISGTVTGAVADSHPRIIYPQGSF